MSQIADKATKIETPFIKTYISKEKEKRKRQETKNQCKDY
jgi:hypothetical protein